MYKMIKPLQWVHRKSDDVVYSNPKGMRWGYYIKQDEENHRLLRLAYVEDSGAFKEHDTYFDTLELAQEFATKHYQEMVSANILVEFLQ